MGRRRQAAIDSFASSGTIAGLRRCAAVAQMLSRLGGRHVHCARSPQLLARREQARVHSQVLHLLSLHGVHLELQSSRTISQRLAASLHSRVVAPLLQRQLADDSGMIHASNRVACMHRQTRLYPAAAVSNKGYYAKPCQTPKEVAHDSPANTWPSSTLLYLTYLPFPLSIS
jgi:hypothetical protein